MGLAMTVAQTSVPAVSPQTERLRAMVDAHIDAIARVLRRLGVPEADVDDAVQQVFLTASRRLGDIVHGAEKAFLYKTALHVAAHARRTLARRKEEPVEDFADVAEARGPGDVEDAIDRQRAAVMLEGVLDAMPEELRAVFVLFEVEELSVPEIAALVEIPVGTAASRLRRAREDFQERVGRLRARRARGGRP
jgi:RNA polymerase sigma-70 factor (ECF subfamily)